MSHDMEELSDLKPMSRIAKKKPYRERIFKDKSNMYESTNRSTRETRTEYQERMRKRRFDVVPSRLYVRDRERSFKRHTMPMQFFTFLLFTVVLLIVGYGYLDIQNEGQLRVGNDFSFSKNTIISDNDTSNSIGIIVKRE